MNYYSVIGLLAAVVLIIVNYDILFRSDDSPTIPAIGIYRKFLYGIMAYYISDMLWGIFDSLRLATLLFWDTVVYYVAMAVGVLLWTQYVVTYLAEDNAFGRFLSRTGQLLFAAVVAATVINCFLPVLFWFDEAGVYHACPARHLQLAAQILLLLLTAVYAFRAMARAEDAAKKRYRAIWLFGLAVAIMLLVQLKYPLLPLYSVGYMLGSCLLHTFVVSEEIEAYKQGLQVSQQQAREQEKMSRAKSDFLSTISHELRTPINAILGMNEVILRECEDRKILGYAESMRTAGTSLLGLVNDILDFSKIEAGKIEIIPVEYDLASLLSDLVCMVKVRAEAKGLELVADFDKNIPRYLRGDEIRIKQVITNLLSNAVKYTEQGRVIFSVGFDYCEEDTNSVLLHVAIKDTGIGIKPEDMDKLFSKFERIEEERNRNVEGTGLGLSITKNLLEKMDSSLQVESAYGIGSTFCFTLRQRVTKWELLGDYQEAHQDTVTRKRKKYREKFTAPTALVLVVDDNPMNLTVFKNLLKNTKVKIETAGDGDEGLLLAHIKKYDLIFLDHMMPRKDGIETLHELRAEGSGPNVDTPAICLTANAIAGTREQCLEAGFDEYMTKPIDSGKLEDALLSYLPKEKIEKTTDEETESAKTIEIPKMLAPLRDKDWINIPLGIQNNGNAESYLPLLKIFYDSMDGTADEIDGYYAAENWKDYAIKVHALKSSARLIGATDFSEDAQLLEDAGKSGDVNYIHEHQKAFMEKYKGFKAPLSEIFSNSATEEAKPEADKDLMESVWVKIRLAAEDMDSDRLEAIFAETEAYRIPEAQSELYGKVRHYASLFDYKAILSLVKKE